VPPATSRPLKLPTSSARVRAENKVRWNKTRSPDKADFFTVGYEGRTTEALIESLRTAGVRSVLDIRHTPVSMYRPDLSKSNFQKIVEKAGLEYIHVPQWGVPKPIRARAVESGTRDTIWDWYDAEIVSRFFDRNLHWFLNLEHPVAMMCVECDPTECHRHRIFLALERKGLRGYDL
jgi:uncharacterized protein (DUF488 family)